MTRRSYALLGAALLTLGASRPAFAQTETRAAVAEALYRQARDLMAQGKYDEACPKFAESQRLDPATGTLLNLAACHERQGKLATAWLEYSDAIVASRRDARDDRVQYASERVAELEPKLSRLTLLLAPDADVTGLAIELDGASVGRAVIGAPTPVDPGPHTVKVSAPGKRGRTLNVEVAAVADQKSLLIPKLEDAPPDAPPPEPAAPQPVRTTMAPTRDELAVRPVPTSVYVAGGITLALAAGAGVTGVVYLKQKDDYESTGQDKSRAQTTGAVNLGLWIGAALSAGVTTYLYATRPTERSVAVTPVLGPQLAGLGVSGGF